MSMVMRVFAISTLLGVLPFTIVACEDYTMPPVPAHVPIPTVPISPEKECQRALKALIFDADSKAGDVYRKIKIRETDYRGLWYCLLMQTIPDRPQ